MSGIRQGITMVVGTYYLLKMFNKEISELHYLIIVALLYFIHRSSLILVFIYLFNKFADKRILMMILAISFGFSVFQYNPFLKVVANLEFVKKTSFNYTGIGFGLDKQTIFRLPFLFFVLITKPKEDFEKKQKNAILSSYVIYFLFKSSELVAARFLVYGWMLLVVYLPNNIYIEKFKMNKLFKKFVLVSIMLFFCLNQISVVYSQIGLFERASGNEVKKIKYISVFNKNRYSFSKKIKYERLQGQ